MPRTDIQYQQIKDERKLSILNASVSLFAIDREKVSVDAISNKAKCSHGLVYHYFKDTDSILLELKQSDNYSKIEEKLLCKNDDDSAFNLIRKIVQEMILLSNPKNKNDVGFALILLGNEGKTSFSNHLISLIKQGQNNGEITGGNPSDIANCLIYLFKGIYLEILTQKHPKISVPSIDNILQIFIKKSALRRAD